MIALTRKLEIEREKLKRINAINKRYKELVSRLIKNKYTSDITKAAIICQGVVI